VRSSYSTIFVALFHWSYRDILEIKNVDAIIKYKPIRFLRKISYDNNKGRYALIFLFDEN